MAVDKLRQLLNIYDHFTLRLNMQARNNPKVNDGDQVETFRAQKEG